LDFYIIYHHTGSNKNERIGALLNLNTIKASYQLKTAAQEAFVECFETDDRSSICKTCERNCYDECSR